MKPIFIGCLLWLLGVPFFSLAGEDPSTVDSLWEGVRLTTVPNGCRILGVYPPDAELVLLFCAPDSGDMPLPEDDTIPRDVRLMDVESGEVIAVATEAELRAVVARSVGQEWAAVFYLGLFYKEATLKDDLVVCILRLGNSFKLLFFEIHPEIRLRDAVPLTEEAARKLYALSRIDDPGIRHLARMAFAGDYSILEAWHNFEGSERGRDILILDHQGNLVNTYFSRTPIALYGGKAWFVSGRNLMSIDPSGRVVIMDSSFPESPCKPSVVVVSGVHQTFHIVRDHVLFLEVYDGRFPQVPRGSESSWLSICVTIVELGGIGIKQFSFPRSEVNAVSGSIIDLSLEANILLLNVTEIVGTTGEEFIPPQFSAFSPRSRVPSSQPREIEVSVFENRIYALGMDTGLLENRGLSNYRHRFFPFVVQEQHPQTIWTEAAVWVKRVSWAVLKKLRKELEKLDGATAGEN